MRADDIHEHVAKHFLHAVRMGVPVAEGVRLAFVRGVAGNDVDQFLLRRARCRSATGRLIAFFSISGISFMGSSPWPAIGLTSPPCSRE
jgi:hypothetical protein